MTAAGPLRVMFVVPNMMVGGAERHASTLLASMDPERVRGSIVCLQDRGNVGSTANWARLEAADVPRTELRRGKRDVVGTVRALVREMRAQQPDIVVLRGFNAELLGRVAGILARVPHLLVWVRNCGGVVPAGRGRRWVNRQLARATDDVYGVAWGQLPYITGELGYDARKLRIVYNGIDPTWMEAAGDDPAATRRELGLTDEHTVIGTVAVMRQEKDHPTLLRAFRRVVDQHPDARLLLVGDGPERANLEALIDELDLTGHVLLLGHQDDPRRLHRVFDVFTLSSRTVEACPNSLLEAMSAGKPAVCTAVGGVPEMIVNGVTGRVVPAEDPAALAAGFLELLADPEAAREMGAAGRRRVNEVFTLDRSVAEAQNAFEETAGREARTPVLPRRDEDAPELAWPGPRTDVIDRRPLHVTLVLDVAAHGGAETVLRNTFAHLDPDRVVTDVVCLREEGPLAGDFRAGGVPVTVLERSGRFDPSTLPRLVRHLRRVRTDVVLVANYHKASLLFGRLAAVLAGGPVSVIAAHNMDRTVVGSRVLPRWAVNTLFLSRGLALLSPSQGRYLHDEEGVNRGPLSRVREYVVPNGIMMPPPRTDADRASARAELGVDDGHVVVCVLARLTSAKAHHVLFEAVADLHDPRLHVAVVGDGPRRAELEGIVAARNLERTVTFLGQRRDVVRLLAGSDVFALSSDHEGVPISIMEAMAQGLPVVSTDVGAVADLVSDGEEGYLVERGDAAALGARLRKLADDPDLRREMGERARARARRDFTIEGTAEAFTRLAESVTGRDYATAR
ncbi:glycosyltransferase [Actinomycetospora straminea]|uniref:Glycosyltransferase involved in cell wall biosynthesis n=1 Tax=Actinomycetospora straminea TaxID=663607 RepID=A0ABP9E0P5_9PSEU|nr:glycosyltransferase [Actinomycetospora straminea]MDD7931119.1 glycosyltransferase [Actinomycetospora straminea]